MRINVNPLIINYLSLYFCTAIFNIMESEKYTYHNIKDIDPSSPESKRINMYGICIDSSFPYYIEKTAKHIVIIKISDESV